MLRKINLIIAVILLSFNLCGCALLIGAAAGGAGTAAWLTGKLTEDIDASYDRTFEAVKDALRAMDLLVLEEKKGNKSSSVKSRYVDGSNIWIDVTPITAKTTKVEVRVGVKGSETASREIMKKIKSQI